MSLVPTITSPFSHNNHSQVLKVSDGRHSFLFAGDIEAGAEQRGAT
ncbi:MAG: hypothetical protein KAT34_16130 [Candidatus Aminicenantes bacterium]|nr:hypothetical protein [Candidatus Aminicenantes bacterium]